MASSLDLVFSIRSTIELLELLKQHEFATNRMTMNNKFLFIRSLQGQDRGLNRLLAIPESRFGQDDLLDFIFRKEGLERRRGHTSYLAFSNRPFPLE